LPIVIEWLKKESPDVLCVQELKCQDKDFPQKAFQEINYNMAFKGEKSYNGVAILSKLLIKDVKIGFDKEETYGPRLITATINNIPIINTYVPQGFEPDSEKFVEKLNWFERLYEFLNKNYNPEKPLIWLGDFNVAPEGIDVYDPEKLYGHVGYHPDEHAALKRLKDWGFIDIFRKHNPGPDQFTFWDYRIKNGVKRNLGWRIDHIWATKTIARKSVGSWIDREPRLREKPSDHTPIVAEFE
jgi:exodeoxyribonuclease-3